MIENLKEFVGGNVKQRDHLNEVVRAVKKLAKDKHDGEPLNIYTIRDGDLVLCEFRGKQVAGPF